MTPTVIRRVAAAFLVAHGVAHLVGLASSWRLGDFEDAPFTTVILDGAVDVGDAGIRIVGLLWIAAAIAFIGAAAALWRGARARLAPVGLFSLAVCLIGLPAAVIGVGIDVVILALLAATWVVRPVRLGTVLR